MKRAFTLVEMLVVIIIIWFLLWVLSFFSWSYISKLNVENDIETMENVFSSVQASSLSQPNFWKINNVSYVWIDLTPNKNYVYKLAFTWEDFSKKNIVDIKSFSYIKIWTWFEIYSWTTFEKSSTNKWYFLYRPYTMGSFFVEKDGTNYNIFSWDYTINFYIESIYKGRKCFSVHLESWRLKEIKCN